jgi:hypothetical protein
VQVSLNRVRIGTNFPKWGNLEEFLLNGVITVTNDKVGGIKWNLLFLIFRYIILETSISDRRE